MPLPSLPRACPRYNVGMICKSHWHHRLRINRRVVGQLIIVSALVIPLNVLVIAKIDLFVAVPVFPTPN